MLGSIPKFPGQDNFTGNVIHSVKYKDVIKNNIGKEKPLVVIGIGNSAVDIAVNAVNQGGCEVYLSTRSGAWVAPNYIMGHPIDHYACRALFWLPWKLTTRILETVLCLIFGSPYKWKLNPKMRALQTQPTVSPTLVHHIQRANIKMVPNIKEFTNDGVIFTDGTSTECDDVILATGYHIDLPFLSIDYKAAILDEETNAIKLFKNVFSPEIGPSLAFIGFVQPASGGILSMSETQARWFVEICKQKCELPSHEEMFHAIESEKRTSEERYFKSARHTIQKDPAVYNDDIASYFGAKPQIWKYPLLAWKLLFGTGGAAQWRLQGPYRWSEAPETVNKAGITDLTHYTGLFLVGFICFFVLVAFLCISAVL